MKKYLLELLNTEYKWTITEAVINEIIEDEDPLETLLYIDKHGSEWWIVKCLEFEKDSIKFFNKYKDEINHTIKHMSASWMDVSITEWYSIQDYYAHLAFDFLAFELYMRIIFEDL